MAIYRGSTKISGAGKDGTNGKDGVTFTPHIENNTLSFTNNGGLDNPDDMKVATLDEDTNKLKLDLLPSSGTYASDNSLYQIGGVSGLFLCAESGLAGACFDAPFSSSDTNIGTDSIGSNDNDGLEHDVTYEFKGGDARSLSFMWVKSSENTCDIFRIYINGTCVAGVDLANSNNILGATTTTVANGNTVWGVIDREWATGDTLRLQYKKDSSCDRHGDVAGIGHFIYDGAIEIPMQQFYQLFKRVSAVNNAYVFKPRMISFNMYHHYDSANGRVVRFNMDDDNRPNYSNNILPDARLLIPGSRYSSASQELDIPTNPSDKGLVGATVATKPDAIIIMDFLWKALQHYRYICLNAQANQYDPKYQINNFGLSSGAGTLVLINPQAGMDFSQKNEIDNLTTFSLHTTYALVGDLPQPIMVQIYYRSDTKILYLGLDGSCESTHQVVIGYNVETKTIVSKEEDNLNNEYGSWAIHSRGTYATGFVPIADVISARDEVSRYH